MPLFTLTPAPRLMYAFRYREELTGKWTKARYRAEHRYRATIPQDGMADRGIAGEAMATWRIVFPLAALGPPLQRLAPEYF